MPDRKDEDSSQQLDRKLRENTVSLWIEIGVLLAALAALILGIRGDF